MCNGRENARTLADFTNFRHLKAITIEGESMLNCLFVKTIDSEMSVCTRILVFDFDASQADELFTRFSNKSVYGNRI